MGKNDAMVLVRMPQADKDAFFEACAAAGLTPSKYLRQQMADAVAFYKAGAEAVEDSASAAPGETDGIF